MDSIQSERRLRCALLISAWDTSNKVSDGSATTKYVSKGYSIQLKVDTGGEEVYTINSVEPSTKAQTKSASTFSESMAGLVIGPRDGFEIYEMDWRSKVILEDEDGDREAKLAHKDRTPMGSTFVRHTMG